MDVPLALNHIGIRSGLKGYKRESSTFSQKTDAVGLSACNKGNEILGYFPVIPFIKNK